ncbi:iron ABC transporter ATP-binding protein [Salimicrobium album]|uniref:Iron complex transport system ATP-binding protein n=1 Tax=Salimicrobium album TaxID=50717 RepID=A0A1H3J2T9_9BACI|nr:ABC transporter ATP-binding protein [Salimicrobium album]SDY33859.1 iron complex transport system ATP-binding protein [Salimicrobium album]
MVDVTNVSKAYKEVKVVDDVSVHIKKGTITSFIGANGAGKSTLLSMVSRLIPKDEGSVLLDGEEITSYDNKELAKRLSVLKQSNNIKVRITVRELVSFGRFPYSQGKLKKEDEKLINEAIEYMQLEDFEDRFLDELSGGQKQRAYIAMVIAQDTDYILLDEPLNNLDMKHSKQIMKALRRMVDDLGKTVVIVIHDINFASCYSNHIVALKDGKCVYEGHPEEMITNNVLREVYDMEFNVCNIDGNRICVFFT